MQKYKGIQTSSYIEIGIMQSSNKLSYLVCSNFFCQSSVNHLFQCFLFTLGLTCEFGAAVTKPCYVVLNSERNQAIVSDSFYMPKVFFLIC